MSREQQTQESTWNTNNPTYPVPLSLVYSISSIQAALPWTCMLPVLTSTSTSSGDEMNASLHWFYTDIWFYSWYSTFQDAQRFFSLLFWNEVNKKKGITSIRSVQPSFHWQDFSHLLPVSPCSHVTVRMCVCVCVHANMYVPVCISVCLHVSETRHDLVSGEGLGSPGPARSRPDSAAELINISLQSKVGSATRPRGCTNWWKLTAG